MSRPTILLVDDTKLFLEMEKEFLRECAVVVYTAANGREALDLLTVIRPDIIFMDLHMPELDGAACCAAIKADPDLCAIPVIIVSVTSEEPELERCRAAGCDGVITKPVRREEFLEFGHRFIPGLGQTEKRVPCQAQVVFKISNQAQYGMVTDLSTHGLYIAFNGTVFPDDLIELHFILPGDDLHLLQASGRVAWVNSGEMLFKPLLPAGFGVEFTHLSPEAGSRVSEFMAKAMATAASFRIETAYFMTENC